MTSQGLRHQSFHILVHCRPQIEICEREIGSIVLEDQQFPGTGEKPHRDFSGLSSQTIDKNLHKQLIKTRARPPFQHSDDQPAF